MLLGSSSFMGLSIFVIKLVNLALWLTLLGFLLVAFKFIDNKHQNFYV